MTVNYKTSVRTFTAGDVLAIKRDLVNDLITEALVSTTEGFIDMCFDSQTDDPTFVTPAGILRNLNQDDIKASALEYLTDMLGDLQLKIKSRMAEVEYKPALNAIKFKDDGEVDDIVVTVTVNDLPKMQDQTTTQNRSFTDSKTVSLVEEFLQQIE